MSYGSILYGTDLFGTETSEGSGIEYFTDLMKLLPEYYQDNKTMKELQINLGYSIGGLAHDITDAVAQCFISSATTGLDRWEQIFGLTTDKTKSYARRREILMAKLRGSGTSTKDMIKNVAIAFSGGEVNVIEYPAEYRFVVQFVGVKGIPPNMAGLIDAIEQIKPAHLIYDFKYTYTTWSMVSSLTWSGVSTKTWAELKVYEEGE